ncbi:MAG: ABC transporter permease subunit [Lentisphaerae bacterium]|jgi:microcin C transport system permease protein|nr:ABC transporter permease subunit [Lentisphaerota bacterium]MBT4823126.1 ABC transporter permease subunit [Lentisphaerota bacterium]MBT5610485.1 ABC transporter permease subunit [Lentisphaerota bacterium]MBT7061076.1 ABC transporter permease subunit [Lentisphaerota bacterium]
MERLDYFIRRLLLVIPTFIGITLVCFAITQFVPGGPVEQAMMQMRGVGGADAGRTSVANSSISEEQRLAIRQHFGFDQPLLVQYWRWLVPEVIGMRRASYKFPNKTAWQLIKERFPVSIIFGVTGFLLTYVVCIPLGMAKALRHGSSFDLVSSVAVFVGYAIPPFAFGMVLKALLCGTVDGLWDVFPVAGFYSDGFAELSVIGKISDLALHMFLPVLCYMIGSFAVLTLLMKNSLLEQISSDYIRTVLAKGGSSRRAIWGHALRNSLVPIATGFGRLLTLMFAGSVIIERVFEIPGMGRLSLDAIVGRDYSVFLGILALTSGLGLLGNILSDFCYVLIDPRINFRG